MKRRQPPKVKKTGSTIISFLAFKFRKIAPPKADESRSDEQAAPLSDLHDTLPALDLDESYFRNYY